jgi:hypothetical protein
MSVSLGVFDVFANAVPGSLYLAIAVYLANRFEWLDVHDLRDVDSALLILGAIIAAYLAAVLALQQGRRFAASADILTFESIAWARGVDHYFGLLEGPAGAEG